MYINVCGVFVDRRTGLEAG